GVKRDDMGDRDKDGIPDKVDATPDGKPVVKKQDDGKDDDKKKSTRVGRGPSKDAAKKDSKEPRDAGHGYKIVDTQVTRGQRATMGSRDLDDRDGIHAATVHQAAAVGPTRWRGKVGNVEVTAAKEQAWVDQAKRAHAKQVKDKSWKPTGKPGLGDGKSSSGAAEKIKPQPQPQDKIDATRATASGSRI